jgi:uncharacterized protein YoxC
MDWARIIVIILALFLAIFLLLGIGLLVLLIKVTRQIKSVTDSAERTARSVEGSVEPFHKLTSPLLMMRMVTRQLKKFKR